MLMSIQNAINFFDAYTDDDRLRMYLGLLDSPEQVRNFLKEIDMDFYDEELEEAYNLLLLRCSDEADHNVLSQVKISYIELISERERNTESDRKR
jgi:hypothetical protein